MGRQSCLHRFVGYVVHAWFRRCEDCRLGILGPKEEVEIGKKGLESFVVDSAPQSLLSVVISAATQNATTVMRTLDKRSDYYYWAELPS